MTFQNMLNQNKLRDEAEWKQTERRIRMEINKLRDESEWKSTN